eukprot:5595604-Ditylum_brightwellii.AAC.1
MKIPRTDRHNCFCCRACKQKHEYINDKVGCDSRDDIEEVIREDNGVETGQNTERENCNKKELESDEEEDKNEGFEVELIEQQEEEEGVVSIIDEDTDEEENENEETMEDE